MTRCNQNCLLISENTLNDIELPMSPESISRSDSGSTENGQENGFKSLLSLDETIFKNLEFNIDNEITDNKTETSNSEGEKDNAYNSCLHSDVKSTLPSNRLSLNDCNHDLTFLDSNEEFKKCNDSINQDLNESVNLIKKKLFDLSNDETIPRKKKKLISNDSSVLSCENLFYGLPLRVKDMVKRYRGIEKLYGKFHWKLIII